MSYFLIEVDDTKYGVTDPAIVGPFPTADAASDFAEEMQMGTAAESGQGGYSAVLLVGDDACGFTPERYREEFAWRFEEGY